MKTSVVSRVPAWSTRRRSSTPNLEAERAAHAAVMIPDLERLVADVDRDDAEEVSALRATITSLAVVLPILTPAIVAFLEATA